VDPDSRRQVDYAKRCGMLDGLKKLFAEPSGTLEGLREIMSDMEDGRIKMYLTWRVLSFRREQELLFKEGDYLKLSAEGPRASHICAFARTLQEAAAVVIAPRLFYPLTEIQDPPVGAGVWAKTAVEAPLEAVKEYRNILTGETVGILIKEEKPWIPLEDALRDFPVAVLVSSA
jgi:(1->4)-alpha-D-glucan 1-alpha-D-glucosylmutase